MMSMSSAFTRRDALAMLAALGAGSLAGDAAWAQSSMPLRRIPGTNESLPLIGLGLLGVGVFFLFLTGNGNVTPVSKLPEVLKPLLGFAFGASLTLGLGASQ